jgi:PAS domain-containing protein
MTTISPQPTPSVSNSESGSASKTGSVYAPVLALDREGTIQHSNVPARRALEYSSDASLDSCFFSHVHGRNLQRVMRDLAHMVSHRKQRARWLLRLRTGNGRWRWYRAIARNHLDHSDAIIRVHLRPL